MKKAITKSIMLDTETINLIKQKAKINNLETYNFSAIVRYFLRLGMLKSEVKK